MTSISNDGTEYDVVLTKNEVALLRCIVRKAALDMPPDEWTEWLIEMLGPEHVEQFYYTFVALER